MKKAFTMIELVFVIVVIGILAAIALPRFAVTRDDAELAKAKSTIAAVQAALSTERQLRVLRGDFTAITSLNEDGGAFSTFSADGSGAKRPVLENTIQTCKGNTDTACWTVDGTNYTYTMPSSIGGAAVFTLANGRFTCTSGKCEELQ